MEVRPVVIRQELMESFRIIDRQINVVAKEAATMAISPLELRDSSGSWVMIPLLTARVEVLHALTLLNQKEKGN